MNSFGLGLVLNFVDNASAGMSSATQTFMQMSATADSMTSSVGASASEMASIAFSLSAVGDTFASVGESITSVFTGITQQVVNTGMTMQGYRMQLAALYGSTEAGEKKLEDIKQYAMSSVFDIQSLIPAVTMMKAVGIEAMQEVTTSSGSATQKLLDYASDIAAMVPNMRNAYGTGVQAAMGAIKEYVAEGNAMSLKRGAGLDITSILGEKKGSSIAERTQQVADLVDKLNIVGYTASLAGTPTQRLSNMQDALFNSLSKIADSGVFEVYCDLLEMLSNWVFSLVENEETFNVITGVLADTISTILSPLKTLLQFVIDNSNAIIEWVKAHPKLTKSILITVAAIGALLTVGGSLLKLLSSIAFAMTGLKMLRTLPSMFSMLGVAFKTLISKALPFVALASLAYFVWKNNIFGIRDAVSTAMGELTVIIGLVKDAWDDNTLSEENFVRARELGVLPLIEALLQLKYYWGFFTDGFKKGFQSFFDGIVKSLSWLKIMGIDVNGIAASIGEFLKSLIEAGQEDKWEKIGEVVGKLTGALVTLIVLVNVLKPIVSIISGIGKVISGVTKIAKGLWSVLKFLFNPILKVAPAVIGFFNDLGAAISLMKEGFSFFEVMGARFPKFAGVISKIASGFSKIAGLFGKIGSAIANIATKFAGLFSGGAAIASFLGGVAAAIGGVIVYVQGLIDMFKNGENASNILKAAIGGLTGALGAFLIAIGVGATVATGGIAALVVAIVAAVGILVALIVNHWEEIKTWFTVTLPQFFSDAVTAVSEFFANVWSAISGWFAGVVESVKGFFTRIINAILSNPVVQTVIKVMQSIYNCIATVVSTIVTFIKGVATTIWNIIKLVGTVIGGVAKVVWSVISGVVGTIWTCIKGVANFIATCAMGVWNVIKSVVNFIWTLIKTVAGVIKAIVNTVYQFFRMVFYAILAVAKVIITAISNAFQWLWGKIQPVLQAIGDFFSFIFNWVWTNVISPVVNWITTAFTTVKDWIISALQAIGDFFASIFDWINTNVLTPFRDFIGSVFDWINDKVTAVTDWFGNAFQTAADAITGAFEGVKNFFTGVWDSITEGATKFFDWICEKLGWVTDTISAIGDFFGGAIDSVGNWFSGIGDNLKKFVGLDTGGYVKTTGIAVLHPNEVVVNDDTTKRLQNFLGNYEEDAMNGSATAPTQAVLNNIYPTIMESVPVTTVPAEEVSNINNSASFVTNNTQQNFVEQIPNQAVEKAGETHNDYSVTFAAGSVVIQLASASDAELEKAADKLMRIIARKQQLKSMAVRA